jgi:hypothetical protein
MPVSTLPPIADDLDRRVPTWHALSTLFLDTELSQSDLECLAIDLVKSGYTHEQLSVILRREVLPVVGWNLLTPAGVHEGFDPNWLASEIQRRANSWRRNLPSFLLARLIPHEWAKVLWLVRFYSHPGMVLVSVCDARTQGPHVRTVPRADSPDVDLPTYDSVRAKVKVEVTIDDIRVVVLTPSRDRQPDANLLAFASTGSLIWRLPPPSCVPGVADAFVAVEVQNGRLVAWSWSCFRLDIDHQSGRVLKWDFTK